MFAASVYNLLLPAFTMGDVQGGTLSTSAVLQTLLGLMLGCSFLSLVGRYLDQERLERLLPNFVGGRLGMLVFISMFFHSIPEGVAVGVGFASPAHVAELSNLGVYIAIAIAIHNIPEGLAVALPLHSKGVSLHRCFWMAVVTSLPQPLAAVPASLLVWFFKPLMIPSFGFAAGAMMYLVIQELLPEALESEKAEKVAWSFMFGFALMVLVQTVF